MIPRKNIALKVENGIWLAASLYAIGINVTTGLQYQLTVKTGRLATE